MKETIKKLIKEGISISYPYKQSLSSWYSDIGISVTNKSYYVNHKTYYDIDDAINNFLLLAYSSKNFHQIIKKLTLPIDFEYPDELSDEQKTDIKNAKKLVDKDFKKMDIKTKKPPKKSDAFNDFDSIIKITDINKFGKEVDNFIKKYSEIDVYVFLSFNYHSDKEDNTFGSTIDAERLTEDVYYNKINEKMSSDYKFINISLSIKVLNDRKQFIKNF